MPLGITQAEIPARNRRTCGGADAKHTRSFTMAEVQNHLQSAVGGGVSGVGRVQRSMTFHDAHRASGNGNLVAATDTSINEQRIALRGTPALRQPALELFAVGLHATVGRVPHRKWMRQLLRVIGDVHELVAEALSQCAPNHGRHGGPHRIESLLREWHPPRVHPPISSLAHHGGNLPMDNRHISEMQDDLTALRTVEEGAEARHRSVEYPVRAHGTALQHSCAEHARSVDSTERKLQRMLTNGDSCTGHERRQLTLQRLNTPHCAVHGTRMHRRLQYRRPYLRAIFGTALVMSILTLASACDKHTADTEKKQTSLGGKPRALVFLFGDKADPRMLPVAMLTGTHIEPISLDSTGWHNFDRLYFAQNADFSVYQHGVPIGSASVKRGMWYGKDPLYKLPGCHVSRPLAAATLNANPEGVVMYEMLATSDSLIAAPKRTAPTAADQDSAKEFAARAAHKEGLTNKARGELDEVLQAIPTGATSRPTLIASYLEKGSGLTGKPRHVFVIGDYSEAQQAYVTSFAHVPGDSVPEFRRFVDHLDLTGDGVDELLLEGWQREGESYLVILRYQNGHWREAMRTRPSWCDDK